jgi:queuine tRNA-ribosyltransferase
MNFTLVKTDQNTQARRGRLELFHGVVETPVFMPVGTVGSVKGVSNEDLENLGAQIILGNTYHLHLRPTSEVIRDAFDSLHGFNGWTKPILTDSGGYQVFSLGLRHEDKSNEPNLVKISEEGAKFSSHIDGSLHMFTPESVIDIQTNLGSDIMMALDVCPDGNANHDAIRNAMEQTHRWAERGIKYWESKKKFSPQLEARHAYFGIVQGGPHEDLRRTSAQFLTQLPFDGIAIGGVANGGESKEKMHQAVAYAMPHIPADTPRYLMGVGEPIDMVRAVAQGVDMFDCVLPTRLGRHGVAWVHDDDGRFTSLDLAKSKHALSREVIEQDCDCPACVNGYSRGYIHHLIKEKEMLGVRLLSLHNLRFVMRLFENIRSSIDTGTFHKEYAWALEGIEGTK